MLQQPSQPLKAIVNRVSTIMTMSGAKVGDFAADSSKRSELYSMVSKYCGDFRSDKRRLFNDVNEQLREGAKTAAASIKRALHAKNKDPERPLGDVRKAVEKWFTARKIVTSGMAPLDRDWGASVTSSYTTDVCLVSYTSASALYEHLTTVVLQELAGVVFDYVNNALIKSVNGVNSVKTLSIDDMNDMREISRMFNEFDSAITDAIGFGKDRLFFKYVALSGADATRQYIDRVMSKIVAYSGVDMKDAEETLHIVELFRVIQFITDAYSQCRLECALPAFGVELASKLSAHSEVLKHEMAILLHNNRSSRAFAYGDQLMRLGDAPIKLYSDWISRVLYDQWCSSLRETGWISAAEIKGGGAGRDDSEDSDRSQSAFDHVHDRYAKLRMATQEHKRWAVSAVDTALVQMFMPLPENGTADDVTGIVDDASFGPMAMLTMDRLVIACRSMIGEAERFGDMLNIVGALGPKACERFAVIYKDMMTAHLMGRTALTHAQYSNEVEYAETVRIKTRSDTNTFAQVLGDYDAYKSEDAEFRKWCSDNGMPMWEGFTARPLHNHAWQKSDITDSPLIWEVMDAAMKRNEGGGGGAVVSVTDHLKMFNQYWRQYYPSYIRRSAVATATWNLNAPFEVNHSLSHCTIAMKVASGTPGEGVITMNSVCTLIQACILHIVSSNSTPPSRQRLEDELGIRVGLTVQLFALVRPGLLVASNGTDATNWSNETTFSWNPAFKTANTQVTFVPNALDAIVCAKRRKAVHLAVTATSITQSSSTTPTALAQPRAPASSMDKIVEDAKDFIIQRLTTSPNGASQDTLRAAVFKALNIQFPIINSAIRDLISKGKIKNASTTKDAMYVLVR